MNVSLPPKMRAWVDSLVESGDYGTASEYIRDLVRADQVRRARAAISRELRSIVAADEKAPLTKGDWEGIRRAVKERTASGKPRRRAS